MFNTIVLNGLIAGGSGGVFQVSDESTRQKILQAAGPIFARCGFNGATVRAICKAADVNLASINYYFGDKQQLYLEVVKQVRQVRADLYPFPAWTDETKSEEKLYGFVSTLLQRLVALKSAPWEVQLLVREVLHPTEAGRQLVRDYFQPIFTSLLQIVDELVQRPIPEDQRIKIGFSIVGQCLHYRYGSEVISLIISPEERHESFNVDQVARHITEFCLGGVRAFRNDSTGCCSNLTRNNTPLVG